MPNHENRSKKSAVGGGNPRAKDITAARERAKHTQEEAADTIYTALGTLRNWEQDVRPMPPSAYEFYLLRTGQFRVEDLTDAEGVTGMSVMHLRTDDGRLIELQIRTSELPRLCRPAKAA
jgi:DNA-binding XRE family transcriptional regulator